MFACPIKSKIDKLAEDLNSYSDAMQVYLLTEGNYPNKEDAIKIRNRFKHDPFYTKLSLYEDNVRIYNNMTNNGLVLGTSKEELADLQKAFLERGFTIQGDNTIFTVTGSKKLRDRETFGFTLDRPTYQATDVAPEDFYQDKALLEQEEKPSFNKVDYQFKAVTKVMDNLNRISNLFKQIGNNDKFWQKIQQDFQIPKEQINLLKEYKGTTMEEKLASFAATYSYTVEVETSISKEGYYDPTDIDNFDPETLNKNLDKTKNKPTQYYANLTVPGGTNYTENEIKTPEITPSIKGHAQFSTDKGIGWFRSDDKLDNAKTAFDLGLDEYIEDNFNRRINPKNYTVAETGTPTKTRRILELQSDLFQKGRDKEFLVKGEIEYVDEGSPIEMYPDEKENQFLQLLNKDNNWVTFFVKSIIQDSAKKGYEKILFPSGNTASKVEGHSTLEEFKKQKEDRIKELEKQLDENKNLIGKKINIPTPEFMSDGELGTEIYTQENYNTFYKSINNEINQLKQELERVEKEGFGALKPIYNFYENTVTNILKKQYGKENVKQVTDEYGNTWNEVSLDKVRDTAPIAFNKAASENKQAKAVVVKILDKLSKKFNVPYEIIDSIKANKLYDNYGGEKAFFYKGKVYLLEDGVTLENAFHEFSHPFIRAIAQKNTELFTNIVEEILSTSEGNKIYDDVKRLYPEHIVNGELNYAGFEEVAVRALTTEAEKQYETKEFKNAVQRLLKAIRNLLRSLFSTNTVDNINANTSLKDLAKILIGEDYYDLSQKDNTFAANREEPFVNPETNTVLKAIKDWLVERKENLYKHKTDTGILSKLNKINKIEENLRELSVAETIVNIVEDTYTSLADPDNPDSFSNKFRNILTEVANANTREEAERVIEKIGIYKEYVSSLKIIEDLRKYQLEEERPREGSTLQKLNEINNALSNIDNKLNKAAPYILAIANKGAITPELKKNIEAYYPLVKKLDSEIELEQDKGKKAKLVSQKEDLERKLGFPLLNDLTKIYLEGGNDINYFERMVKTVANTSDAAIGLFYKRYKEASDKVKKKINELTKKTFYSYKEFVQGKSVDNFENLYESMTEDVNVLRYNTESGQYETVLEKWFVSDFDQNAYNLARKEAYDRAALEEKKARTAAENGDKEGYASGMRAARSIKAKFRKDTTIGQDVLEGRESVINTLKQKRKLFDNSLEGENLFYAYVTNHLFNEGLYSQYVESQDPDYLSKYGKDLLDSYVRGDEYTKVSGMFLVPDKTKFPSKKYNDMSEQDRKHYNLLLSEYKKAQELLPAHERPNLRVPSIEKDIKDILIEQKDVKKAGITAWERNFKSHIEDESKGIVYKGKKKRVPIFYNQSMPADVVSMNITDTVMQFVAMAEDFNKNASLESLALLTKETLGERIVEKKTPAGKKIMNALYKKTFNEEIAETEKFADTQAYKMFESWIDSNIYNERRFAATVGNIRLDKVVDTMLNANALTVLGMDGIKAIANRLTAATNIGIESLGNKYFSFKTLQKGKAKVAQLMYATGQEENLLLDTLKGTKTTHFGQMLDIFDAIQGSNDAVDEIGGSFVKRNASTSLLMGGLSAGEFISQSNMFAAIAIETKVKTKSGEEINLLEAYKKDADGIVRRREDVEFTEEDEQELRNKINAINKELHGVYNKLDEVEAKKTFVGRLLMQFRNFLVPNMERRFQGLHVNFEMNDVVEGYYKTLYRKVITERNYKVWELYNNKDLTENERNNLKKAIAELSTYLVMAALASLLGQMGDDDEELKDNYAYNLALYSTLRLKSEIGFFIPGVNVVQGDVLRILKSPSSANTLLERSAKFSSQLFDPLEEYERKTGPWEKGDSKLKAKTLKLLFGYNGANLDPSIAVENFKNLTN